MTEFWAKVEMMGHVTIAGRVSEVEMFGGKLGRVEVPQPDGTFATQFFGAGSVYRITAVSEEVARAIASRVAPPISAWDLPRRPALPRPDEDDETGPRITAPDDFSDGNYED